MSATSPNYVTAARRKWPAAEWIIGNGQYASIAYCDTTTVMLDKCFGAFHFGLGAEQTGSRAVTPAASSTRSLTLLHTPTVRTE